jgi:PAS domain S-box-containing protein
MIIPLFALVVASLLAVLFAAGLWVSLRRLRRAQGRNRAILAAAVDGIVTIDEHGTIEGFNPAAERLFGYAADEVIGRNVRILMPEPHRSAHDSYLAAYRDTGLARIIGIGREVEGLRKDGSLFPMELSVGECGIRNRRLFAGIVRDITERKQAERQLRESESKARAIFETAVDGIITIDPHGAILTANPAALRLFGYPIEEMIGSNVRLLMPEPDRGGHDGYIARYLATGERHIIGVGRTVEGQRKDGSLFPMELSVGEAAINGTRIFTGIVRDITERKRREEDLRAAKEDAERAHLSQSQFLAAVSHDLRQPVQALTLFTSVLGSKLAGAPASALLDDIRGSVGAMDMLLDALLDVSSLDAGTVVPHETAFSVSTILERLGTEFAPMAEQKEVGLSVVPSSAVVRTDPTLLYRILQNFLSNAVRYTSQGRIVVGCRRRGRKLRIEVVDSGIGIPEPQQQEIFKEFYQINNPERDRTQGLGLGLAIVQRLARLLHCPITVHSEEGRGSVFAVDVVLVGFNRTGNVVPLRSAAPPPAAPGRGLVFIIDDEPTVLKGLRLAFEEWGYTVVTARTELEGIAQLTGTDLEPDVIIADYRLRGICNGAQVMAQLRQMFDQSIPGILITGDTAPERIREATEHGYMLLHKPVDPVHLRAVIAEQIAARNARRARETEG